MTTNNIFSELETLASNISTNMQRIEKARAISKDRLMQNYGKEFRELIKVTSDAVNRFKAQLLFMSVGNPTETDFVSFRREIDAFCQTAEWDRMKADISRAVILGNEFALWRELALFRSRLFKILEAAGAVENDAVMFWFKGVVEDADRRVSKV